MSIRHTPLSLPASHGFQIAKCQAGKDGVDLKTTGLASARSPAERDASDRRAHRRIASSELPEPALIRIPNRPAISLVDLSSGGALLALPFQMQPEARVTLEFLTSAEQLAVPFRLLRCYVAELHGGVCYHAAGVFDQTLKLPATLDGGLTPATSDRLIATLEAFLRASQATNPSSRGTGFKELLSWVVAGLRRGEPTNLISIQIKAHLGRLFPSLSIGPASLSWLRDASTSARFFGLDFRSDGVLTAADRRFLRASAQLITLIDRNAEPQATNLIEEGPSSLVIHSVAEWQLLSR